MSGMVLAAGGRRKGFSDLPGDLKPGAEGPLRFHLAGGVPGVRETNFPNRL
jgi:hypothetical protein